MVSGQLLSLIEEKTSQIDGNSTPPLFGLEYLFLLCTVFNIIQEFFLAFWFVRLSQLLFGNSKVREEKLISEPEISHHVNKSSSSRDNEKLERDEVKMVMEKLGFFCSTESENSTVPRSFLTCLRTRSQALRR